MCRVGIELLMIQPVSESCQDGARRAEAGAEQTCRRRHGRGSRHGEREREIRVCVCGVRV